MKTVSGLVLPIVTSASVLLSACGGGGSASPDPATPAPPLSVIPSGMAVSPVTAPTEPRNTETSVPDNRVLLKHLYRDEVLGGIALEDAQPSPNGTVEVRTLFGLYQEIDPQQNGDYQISLEDNGLAYFRVVNTKPNGAERVHLFYGVPAGQYVTMDSTDIDVPAQASDEAECVEVDIRLTGMDENADARYLVNGDVMMSVLRENTRGAIETVSVCPQTGTDVYLVFVAEDREGVVNYGFNFYQGLGDGDLLEVSLSEQARMVPWSSNVPLDAALSVSGRNAAWGTQSLFRSAVGTDPTVSAGQIPVFDALAVDSYAVSSGQVNDERGLVNHRRVYSPDATAVTLELKNIFLDDVSLGPTALSWSVNSDDLPQAVSGVIFNDDLTQTYAFLSMDPEVILDAQLDIPLQDINLIFNSSLVTLGGFAAPDGSENAFVTTAGIFAGLFATAEGQEALGDQDYAVTADTSELLEIALELLLNGTSEPSQSP